MTFVIGAVSSPAATAPCTRVMTALDVVGIIGVSAVVFTFLGWLLWRAQKFERTET
jgi:hypothetical protein